MKNLIILIITISFFACNQNAKKSDSPIEKFEKILGEQETIFLNEIVSDLDNYLTSNYPEQKSKFKSYLVDISELKVNEYWKIDTVKLKKYRESNLSGKYDTIFPDSVWYDGQSFKIKYPDFDIVEEIIPLKRNNEETNIDSTINSLINEPRFLLKEQSSFCLAIDHLQQSDSLIVTYLEAKEAVGNLSPSILAGGLIYYLTESNEYLVKRIFIMDLYK